MDERATSLDLGKLLRVQAMVNEAAQVEATRDAAGALVRAYLGLRDEVLLSLQSADLKELRDEFDRLFPLLANPPPFNPNFDVVRSHTQLAAAAEEAQLSLRRLGGWIQGLINELTLGERLRLEAETKAKLERRPPTGFRADDES